MAYTYGTVTNCKTYNGQTRTEYQCRLGYQVNSQSIADNTSNVTLQLEVRSISSTYNTYGYNQTTTIDGTSLSAKSFDMRSTNTWQVFGSRTITIKHNTDGSYSATKSGSFTTTGNSTWNLKSGSASVTVAPAKIPRYGTSNQSLNSKTETTIKMNWSSDSTVDYIWYSKDNGSNWTGLDVTDGTSGTYNITGLTPNTTYNIKTRIRRKDSQLTTDSTALAVTTYKVPTNSLSSATETSITVNWSSDSTADYIWYSKDNGSNWVAIGGVSSTSGSYTISGLSSNTYYQIKTRVRRQATQTTYDTATLGASTYNYPYCTESPNFTIGNSLTLKFYNPLSRPMQVSIIGDNNVETSSTTISGVSATGWSGESMVTYLYGTIPTKSSGKYQVKVVYNGVEKIRNNGNTYSIKGTEKPTFTNFTYKDINTTVSNVLGSDQYLVKGLSNLQVTVSSTNKMVGSNSATPKNYVATIDTLNKNVNYSTSDVNLTLGTPVNAGTKRLTVTAYDYRGLYTSAYKDVIIFEHSKPVVNVNIKRLNNFEAETTLKVSGSYSKIIINGTDKNTIIGATYKYREVGGTWSSEKNLNCTITNGEFSCSDVILALDNNKEFEFEISIKDKLQTINRDTYLVSVGQGVFFISSNKKQCYINGKLVKGSLEISGTEPSEGEEIWIRNSKNLININSLSTGYVASTGDLELNYTIYGEKYSNFIKVKPNTTYTFKIFETSDTYEAWFGIGEYSSQTLSSFVKRLTNTNALATEFTFTTSSTTKYIIVSARKLAGATKVQLEKNSKSTEYEEYVEKTICYKTEDKYEEFLNVEKVNNYLNQIEGGKVRVSFGLYDNTSGSNGTITLSDTVNNYNILEIFYRDNNSNDFNNVRVFAPNGKNISLSCIEPTTSPSLNIRTVRYAISGTSMTVSAYTYTQIPTKNYPTVTTNNYLYVTKVVGYK